MQMPVGRAVSMEASSVVGRLADRRWLLGLFVAAAAAPGSFEGDGGGRTPLDILLFPPGPDVRRDLNMDP